MNATPRPRIGRTAAAPGGPFEQLADPASNTLQLERLERRLRDEAVARADGNLCAAARMLGLSRAQLAYQLRSRGEAP
ncbi:MAG: hypothetical protein Tsb007_26720 [Rhizobacter sp.]